MKRFPFLFLALAVFSQVSAAAEAAVRTREAAVAGAFYPSAADELGGRIEGFLEKARASAGTEGAAPRLLVVPHAGYDYSGRTAAHAYARLEGRRFDTVVLIGPCHRRAFPGASVWTDGLWRTPLGGVEVDTATARAVYDAEPAFRVDPAVHEGEHSLEVQLPFLQKTLKEFKIVPIVLNDASQLNVSKLAAAVTKAVEGKNALVVISTDMSHYFDDETARKMDHAAIGFLEAGDAAGLRESLAGRHTEFCGAAAVLTALEILRLWGAAPPRLLDYSNSSDSTGDTSRVVGYGALAAGGPSASVAASAPAESSYTPEQRRFLLGVARESLKSFLSGSGDFPVIKTNDPAMGDKRAVFVTLKKHGELRGCIGSLLPQEALVEAVQNKAVQAATRDPRFRQVSNEELKDVTISISVLSPIRRAAGPDEVVLGRDGVIVASGPKTGVFLPQVARETGWSKARFFEELCSQKAGLPPGCWQDPRTEIYTFEASEFSEEEESRAASS